jgi:pimeloyl-ACP methyl ester carboxylesterase
MLEEARGRIDYDEQGTGPTIVFVPGSWSTRSAWRGVIEELGGRFRIVTTSLLGYGGSEERRTATQTAIEIEAEIAEAVIRRAGGGVHLVGHSFGGEVCLEVAARKLVPLVSLTLIEPPVVNLLSRAGEFDLYEQITTMRDTYFQEFERGDKEAARRVIDSFGGSGSYDALPQRMRDYIVATTATNILDWRSAMDAPPANCSDVGVPSLILCGERTHPSLARSAELLASVMSTASLVTVPGARHFMVATHASEVARLIAQHVSVL